MDWEALSIQHREERLLGELSSCADWKERYSLILDWGAELEPLPQEFIRDEFKVRGCVSQVWLVAKHESGKVHFKASSDSLFVKGLAAMLLKIFSGKPAQEIVSHPSNILMVSGLIQNLSPNRSNGAAAIFAHIKDRARAFLAV